MGLGVGGPRLARVHADLPPTTPAPCSLPDGSLRVGLCPGVLAEKLLRGLFHVLGFATVPTCFRRALRESVSRLVRRREWETLGPRHCQTTYPVFRDPRTLLFCDQLVVGLMGLPSFLLPYCLLLQTLPGVAAALVEVMAGLSLSGGQVLPSRCKLLAFCLGSCQSVSVSCPTCPHSGNGKTWSLGTESGNWVLAGNSALSYLVSLGDCVHFKPLFP